jgi:hypothetical protein
MRIGADPNYGTDLWALAVEMFPGNHLHFNNYLAKSARAQSGACAKVDFSDYGTE